VFCHNSRQLQRDGCRANVKARDTHAQPCPQAFAGGPSPEVTARVLGLSSGPGRARGGRLALGSIFTLTASLATGAEPGAQARAGIGPIDWVVLIAYIGTVLGIGFYYSRRQSTTEEYFMGSRRMNPFVAGIAVFAAFFSIISYIATPGEYVQYGPVLAAFSTLLAVPFFYIIVGWFLIPVIMRLPITTAFELLEARLGRSVRQACAVSYIISALVRMGLILYTGSSILVYVLDCDPQWHFRIVLIIAGVTTTYTLIGGIRTVMVTETVQSFLLMLGAVLTIVLITFQLGGVTHWIPHRWEPHWQPQPLFSSDLHVRASLAGGFLTALIGGICYTITDQPSVQRLLTTRDAKAARRAYLFYNLACAVVGSILVLVAAALLAFYRLHPKSIPDHFTFARNGDVFFPLYLSHNLPHGLAGLIVAGLMGAVMSALAGCLNSTTTVITKDFIETWRGSASTALAKMRQARLLVLILGIAAIGLSVGMGLVSGNLNEIASKTLNLLLCPTFGLFFLAIFVKRATTFGAVMGAVYSTTAAILVGYWDVITGLPKVSFIWINPISFAVSLPCGVLFSLLPTRGRSAKVVGAYALILLVPLALIVGWILTHCH